MPYKRKKVSTIKKVLSNQLFIFAFLVIGVMFLVGCPERLALRFFILLESFNISRINAALAWIGLMLIIIAVTTYVTIKEIRWNNKNLNLPVVDYDSVSLKINNYKNEADVVIDNINKIVIMNKDTCLQIKTKDNKSYILEYLESNRKTYEALEASLKMINPNIEFVDNSDKQK